jgi:RND family efflux transporter MFP subunit
MFTMAFSPVASADEGAAVYQVRVSPVVEKDVHEQLHVYGQVGFDDATLENINLPYSGQVIRLPLLAGEPVRKGETIAEIAVDPSVASAYQQALSSVHYAESEVNRIKKMLADHLATKSQLAVANKALSTARTQLNQLRKQGFGRSIHQIRAASDAVVASVSVQAGQRITAGTTLMQLGHPDRLKVILGVEPADINQIKTGNTVLLQSALSPDRKVHAKVDRVLHAVNPQTRLVDVLVRLSGEQTKPFLPGTIVAADISGRSIPHTLTVASSALVQRGEAVVVMRVHEGMISAVPVRVLLDSGDLVVVSGALTAGQMVVSSGASELHDGDRVNILDHSAVTQDQP